MHKLGANVVTEARSQLKKRKERNKRKYFI